LISASRVMGEKCAHVYKLLRPTVYVLFPARYRDSVQTLDWRGEAGVRIRAIHAPPLIIQPCQPSLACDGVVGLREREVRDWRYVFRAGCFGRSPRTSWEGEV
jgi:hypothetical protein